MLEDSTSSEPLMILLFIGVFVITYYLIIKQTFNKHFAAFLGAVLVLGVAWMTQFIREEHTVLFDETELLHHLTGDFLILIIILGNLIVVDVGSKSGFFHFISIKILKFSGGDPKRLMFSMGLLCIILSVVVNNISAILICASLTILACERLDYDPYSLIMAQMILSLQCSRIS